MISLITALFVSFITGTVWAQNTLKPMMFSAELNNLQILPQRFEYTLLDEDTFKVGDIIVDTKSLIYDIKRTDKGFELSFTWPGTLILSGDLAIKDNNGKALFSTRINPELVTHMDVSQDNSDSGNRATISKLTVALQDSSLFEALQYLPFSVFCLNNETTGAKVYLCSKELFLSQENGQTKIKARSARHPKSQISVNGKELGDQGLIYLNSRDEDVFFRARSQSGAFLEIETRKQDIVFKDFYIGKSGKEMIIVGKGADPVLNNRVKKLPDGMWQAVLSVERPFIYVSGDGNIPLRQEFYIKDSIPKSQNRPYISKASPSQTYASQLVLKGVKPEVVNLQTEATKIDSLKIGKNQFEWTVNNLQKGSENRKSLLVTAEGKTHTASYYIDRGYRFLAEVDLISQLSPSQILGKLHLQAWKNLNWGFALNAQNILSKAEAPAELTKFAAELLWRRHEGLNMMTPSLGAYAELAALQGPSQSTTAIGTGINYSFKDILWVDWLETRLGVTSAKLGDADLSGLVLKIKAYHKLTSQIYGTYNVSMEPALDDSGKGEIQPFLGIGLSYTF